MSKNKKVNFREDYTDDQLNSMYTKQLIHLRNGIRGKRSTHANYAGHRCCEICHEYIGDDWATEIQPRLDELDLYLTRIKKVLSTREHIPGKVEAKAIRQAKAKKRR
jgi:hypothetical protein